MARRKITPQSEIAIEVETTSEATIEGAPDVATVDEISELTEETVIEALDLQPISEVVVQPSQPEEEPVVEVLDLQSGAADVEVEVETPQLVEETPSQPDVAELSPQSAEEEPLRNVAKTPIKNLAAKVKPTKPKQLPKRQEERRSRNKLKFVR